MGFSIQFLHEQASDTRIAAKTGLITVGRFEEKFESSTEFWSALEYERHWLDALTRLYNGAERSCLITSITDPRTANFIFWWPVYRVGDGACFQNHVLFTSDIGGDFDPRVPYSCVPERCTTNEDGLPISEWCTPLFEIAEYLNSKSGNLSP